MKFEGERYADWKGKLKKRWSWKKFRFAWGRWCYQTNCCGDTLARWWEWEI